MFDDMIAVYAFVAWISTVFAYGIFVFWATMPAAVLHKMGITYYPSRYYAIALPAYALVFWILLIFSYIGWNMFHTYDVEDMRTVEDGQGRVAPNHLVRSNSNKRGVCVPDIGDMEPSAVSVTLFSSSGAMKQRI